MIDTSKPMQVVYGNNVYLVTGYVATKTVIAVRYSVYQGSEFIRDFCISGASLEMGSVVRLENVPPKKVERKYWFNHYEESSAGPFPDKENADRWANGGLRIGCTEVDFTFYKGQGI